MMQNFWHWFCYVVAAIVVNVSVCIHVCACVHMCMGQVCFGVCVCVLLQVFSSVCFMKKSITDAHSILKLRT